LETSRVQKEVNAPEESGKKHGGTGKKAAKRGWRVCRGGAPKR